MNKSNQRRHQLKIRMNDAEMLAARESAAAAGLSVAAVVRMSIGHAKPWVLEDRQSLRLVAAEIAKVGNNLNQIARHCNQTDMIDIKVLQRLDQIREQLNEVQKCIFDS